MPKGVKVRIKTRRRWIINPKTRVEENAKVYRRQAEKRKLKEIARETSH
jgi:hypothetical protein